MVRLTIQLDLQELGGKVSTPVHSSVGEHVVVGHIAVCGVVVVVRRSRPLLFALAFALVFGRRFVGRVASSIRLEPARLIARFGDRPPCDADVSRSASFSRRL
jgi:hypothetical protein